MSHRFCSLALAALCGLTHGCGKTGQWSGPPPTPDFKGFSEHVYPVLLRDCAFSGCHGAEHRFFQIFGPGRTRLLASTKPNDAVTTDEIKRSYDRASSMLATSDQIGDALLLRKPLEVSQGGQGHKGVDNFGRNVYRSASDPCYVVISMWSHSATESQLQVAARACDTGSVAQ